MKILSAPGLAAGFGLAAGLFAADVSLDDLRTPAAPAFALVGLAPTKIERPSTPAAFGASLLGAATASQGGVPKNLAFEFTPYWWQDRPAVTLDAYNKAGLSEVVQQSATFSLATYEKEATATTAKYSGIGGGLRFDLVRGQANSALHKKLQARLRELTRTDPDSVLTDAQIEELGRMAASYDSSRVGHQLAVGAAVAYRFEGNDLDHKQRDRYGAWLTYAFKPDGGSGLASQVTFLATARSIVADATPARKTYTDYGAKLLWRDPEHPFALSAEYLHRGGDAEDEAVSVLVQYRLRESTYLFFSHGKQLAGDGGADKNLTIAGLNLIWGTKAKIDVPSN